MSLVLYGYWRSSAAYRVRIGLNLKGLAYEQVGVDLRTGAHKAADFLERNPQGLVPALDTGEAVLTQSLAILEWLEETHPQPALLPRDPIARAQARAMIGLIAADIHPLNNLRVLQALRSDYAAEQAQVDAWAGRWIGAGFEALEGLIGRHGDGWAFGAEPGLVDCFVVPQVYSARRFNVDLGRYPRLLAVDARAAEHPAFAAAHPDRQPDADRG